MSQPDLADRSILVTGGSTGIGLAVCEEVAARGARVIAVARGSSRLEAAVASLPGEGHVPIAMDVSDLAAWPNLIAQAIGDGHLDGLVTAAAVYGPIGPTASVAPEEVSATLQINLLGSFLAIHHALPALLAAKDPAIVTFSGGGATTPLPRYDSYAMSKAGVVRLTENVAVDEPRVRSNAIAPGFVATELHRATLSAGEALAGPAFAEVEKARDDLGESDPRAHRAAELAALLLGPEGAGISGKLISAAWDPWEKRSFRSRLAAEPDLCSLRRIDGVFFGALPGPDG